MIGLRYFIHPGSCHFWALDPAEALLLVDDLLADGWREL